jgi:predicted dithiol-disulfide oxidoreductase (DUF899 family)
MTAHRIGTPEEHLEARLALLEAEKAHTRQGDELARQRRALPWVRVDKDYVFDTEEGEKTLPDLFAGRSQLLVYHFMFGPDWSEGCPVCSYWADNFHDTIVHLNHRDVTMICASRAPVERLGAYKARMGWSFEWVSTGRNDFNYDYGVSIRDIPAGSSQREMPRGIADRAGAVRYNFTRDPFAPEMPGLSAFALDEGVVYHTYSCYARGLDAFNGANMLLDRTPRGRDEDSLPVPVAWLRRHDEYEAAATSPSP